mmetsp:Transcript_16285/g.25166  ORF Transcript_16285/g.25166 Transcript_16285/m.25166 type:complete len:328 (+) Transcript_16285:2582-3565(+)
MVHVGVTVSLDQVLGVAEHQLGVLHQGPVEVFFVPSHNFVAQVGSLAGNAFKILSFPSEAVLWLEEADHPADVRVRPSLGIFVGLIPRLRGGVIEGWVQEFWLGVMGAVGSSKVESSQISDHLFDLVNILVCGGRPDVLWQLVLDLVNDPEGSLSLVELDRGAEALVELVPQLLLLVCKIFNLPLLFGEVQEEKMEVELGAWDQRFDGAFPLLLDRGFVFVLELGQDVSLVGLQLGFVEILKEVRSLPGDGPLLLLLPLDLPKRVVGPGEFSFVSNLAIAALARRISFTIIKVVVVVLDRDVVVRESRGYVTDRPLLKGALALVELI